MNKKQAILVAIVVLIIISAVAASAYLFAIGTQRETEDSRISVIVTIPPQQEFVERVGGSKVRVTVMVPPGASPHTYEPTASQMKDVVKAKIYAKMGSGVEFELTWMQDLIESNEDMLVVDCSEGIVKMENDPHIWNSPLNVKIITKNIYNGLVSIDSDNEEYYAQNKNDYLKELDILDVYIHSKLDGYTNRAFMTYHPSFGYLANDYNLTQIAVEHGGKEPTPPVIQDSIEKAQLYNLEYVFVAPQFATESCETIADAIGGQTAPMDPLASNYISNMGNIADLLALEFEA